MNTRPRRDKLIFDCQNNSEYCYLQKTIGEQRKCVTYKKSIHFTCRYYREQKVSNV